MKTVVGRLDFAGAHTTTAIITPFTIHCYAPDSVSGSICLWRLSRV